MAIRVVVALVFLSVFFLGQVYLYRRLVADVTTSRWLRALGLSTLLVPFLAVPLARFPWAGEAPVWPVTALLVLWGMTMYALAALVLADGARSLARARLGPPENPERRQAVARLVAGTAAGTGLVVGALGTARAFAPAQVTELALPLRGLPRALDGFTIIHLTDLHVGPVIQEAFVDQLVETASRLQGDLLAITGDLVDGSPDRLGQHVARLNRIKTRHGTYFVSGNHDFYSGWGPWKDTLRRLGWQVLDNRKVELPDGLQLLGVDDYGHPGGSERAYDLEAATAGLDPQRPSVLLAHQPVNLDAVAAKGIGLQLSGHTHGGQMFPATLVAQLMWGERAAGLSRHGQDTWCYTSRGCGFVGPPMRVAAPPEVVKLVLTSA